MKFNLGLINYEIEGEVDSADREYLYLEYKFSYTIVFPKNIFSDLFTYINTLYKDILKYTKLYTIKDDDRGYVLALPEEYSLLQVYMKKISSYIEQLLYLDISIEDKLNSVTEVLFDEYDENKKHYMTFAVNGEYVNSELGNLLIELGMNTYTNNSEIVEKYNKLSDYEKLAIDQLLLNDMKVIYTDNEYLDDTDNIDDDKNLN